jgi:hypothetical protein
MEPEMESVILFMIHQRPLPQILRSHNSAAILLGIFGAIVAESPQSSVAYSIILFAVGGDSRHAGNLRFAYSLE